MVLYLYTLTTPMSNTLIRRFPKSGTDVFYNRKQIIEMNILLMQPFFPEPFTNKEIEILVAYNLCYKVDEPLLTKANKEFVVEKTKLKNITTLNEYNKRLRNKYGLIVKKGLWTLNPILVIPEGTKELQLTVVVKER